MKIIMQMNDEEIRACILQWLKDNGHIVEPKHLNITAVSAEGYNMKVKTLHAECNLDPKLVIKTGPYR